MIHSNKKQNKEIQSRPGYLDPIKGHNVADQHVKWSSWRKMTDEEKASLPSPPHIKTNDERMAEFRVHIARSKGEIV